MNLDLNQFAVEVHENAVAHGFYDPAPSNAETIALIHSEISEALQEWRNNRPMVWYECNGPICIPHQDEWCAGIDDETGKPCPLRDPEPHGIAVELIDVVLRVLDYFAYIGADVKVTYGICNMPLSELIVELHREVALAYRERDSIDTVRLTIALETILTYLREQNLDPEALLREKHAYNRTRPYRHGDKRI